MIETTDKISKHFREILAERDVLANQRRRFTAASGGIHV
jgi:hypothetical protein